MELITHRFTPKSKTVLNQWYNASTLDMDEDTRARKRTRFGSLKYVYPAMLMKEMREFFEKAITEHLPSARIFYTGLELSLALVRTLLA
jgi:spore photoproduct lyase